MVTDIKTAIKTLRDMNKKDGLGLYVADSLEMGARALESHLETINRINNKECLLNIQISDIKKSRGWEYAELKLVGNGQLDEKAIDMIIDRVIHIYTYENLSILESIVEASKEFCIDEKTIRNILKDKFKDVFIET